MDTTSPTHSQNTSPPTTRWKHTLDLTGGPERQDIISLLLNGSGCASAYQTLESGYQYLISYRAEQAIGFTAFVAFRRHIICAGAPVVRNNQDFAQCVFDLKERFPRHRILFVAIEEQTRQQFHVADIEHTVLKIGEQPEWLEPLKVAGPQSRTLRSQLNRAVKKGVKTHRLKEAMQAGLVTANDLEVLRQEWLSKHPIAPIGFLAKAELRIESLHESCWIALSGQRLVGLIACIPTPGQTGWFFEDLFRHQDAPHGTMELLVKHAFDQRTNQTQPFVTLGMVPFTQLEPSLSTPAARFLRFVKSFVSLFYRIESLRHFKNRFRPNRWSPMFLLSINGPTTISDLFAVGRAIVGGSLSKYAVRSFRHWREKKRYVKKAGHAENR